MSTPIYLDNAATTPLDPRVLEQMLPAFTSNFGNPGSAHIFGKNASDAVEKARYEIATTIGCDSKEIIFTSGATEANNLAIKGICQFYHSKGKHIITLATEHKSTLESLAFLETQGFTITYIKPKADGLIDIDDLEKALSPDTILLTLSLVNSEIGVIQDIKAIGKWCKNHGLFFHVDAAQAIGKVAIDLQQLSINLMSMSAHKAHGPKGIGALYIRRHPRTRLITQIHGGAQERSLRAGTLATALIIGMGHAFKLANLEYEANINHIRQLRDKIIDDIIPLQGITINGSHTKRVVHNLNLAIAGVTAYSLMEILSNVAMATGSTCSASFIEPSYVLKALGLDQELARGSIRITLSKFNTMPEIKRFTKLLRDGIESLRRLPKK